jgi:hydrogenase-4 membrane subunit HyfE
VKLADWVFTVGVFIVLASLAIYLAFCCAFGVLVFMNVAAAPDVLAIPMILFLLGLLLMGVAAFAAEIIRQKGNLHGRRLDKR